MQQAPAGGMLPGRAHDQDAGAGHLPVGRRRLGRRLHPGRLRLLPRDRQPLGPGRVGPVRLLRVAFAVLLGPAPAPGVHARRPAGPVRAHRGEGRRARDPARHARHRPPRSGPRIPGRRSSATRTTTAASSSATSPNVTWGCCGRPAKGNPNGPEPTCSSRSGRSSSRSTRPSKGSSTWNGTAARPRRA
jgi:hypothetical protein